MSSHPQFPLRYHYSLTTYEPIPNSHYRYTQALSTHHFFFFFSSRRRHTRSDRDWSSDVCSSDLVAHSAADEGEILNLGVAPTHRRQGIGRALVERVLQELAGLGVRTVYLEVRASNTSARRLYESLGFGEVARRARYYRRPVEDAVVLRAAIAAEGGSAKL